MPLSSSLSWELYKEAARNAVLPFRRVYFDTEPLRAGGWPRPSKQLFLVLHVANLMQIDLCFPEPTVREREEQWLRAAGIKLASIRSKVEGFNSDAAEMTVPVEVSVPTEERLRADYRSASISALKTWPITSLPFTSRSAKEIFELAIKREFTFEEKGDNVVGFQDAVILLSVIDHALGDNVPSAFVSKDSVFRRIPQINRQFGIQLVAVVGLDALDQILASAQGSAFDAVLRQWSDQETQKINKAIEMARQALTTFIKGALLRAEVEKKLGGSIISDLAIQTKEINNIRPSFPHERKGDRVEFSFDVSVQFSAVVEFRPYALLMAGLQLSNEEPVPVRLSRTSMLSVHVDADAFPDYSDIHFSGAHIAS